MKKINFLFLAIALSGCVRLAPASLVGTVWEAKQDTAIVQWEDTTMTRIGLHSISFTDSVNCTKNDAYLFSLPGHNGSSSAAGKYVISGDNVKMIFAFQEEVTAKLNEGELLVGEISYLKK